MSTNIMPLPKVDVAIRPAVLSDLAFIDGLQKIHTKQVGWMPTKQFEGKINAGHVIVAEEAGAAVGYCIGHDQYFKRDDVGIIYQMNVVPGRQRGLVGARLLKAQFEKSAWGCKLYCCWCAQDIGANKFWEAMGFVPLAFRSGSAKKSRTHIFWQRRIRQGDTTTPYWFPSQTSAGSIREDRLVLPIPPGTHWSDAMPMILPSEKVGGRQKAVGGGKRALPSPPTAYRVPPTTPKVTRLRGGMQFSTPKVEAVKVPKAKQPSVKTKNDPQLVAAARELRDRWLEEVNAGRYLPGEARFKYDVAKSLAMPVKQLAA